MIIRFTLSMVIALWAWAAFSPCAYAHGGPTFPILQHRASGPYHISVWADPDVGTALFYVILEDAAGKAVTEDDQVTIGIQPLAGRLPETMYPTERRTRNGQSQFVARVGENTEGMWRVRALVKGPRGSGEVTTQVKAMAYGLSQWDVALYVFPFAAIGIVFLKAFLQRMRPQTPIQNVPERRLS